MKGMEDNDPMYQGYRLSDPYIWPVFEKAAACAPAHTTDTVKEHVWNDNEKELLQRFETRGGEARR